MTRLHAFEKRSGRGMKLWTIACAALLLLGCQNETTNLDMPIAAYRDRMLVQHQDETTKPVQADKRVPAKAPVAKPAPGQIGQPDRAALIAQPATTSQPAPEDVFSWVPDPVNAPAVFQQRLEKLRAEQATQQDQRVVRNFERVMVQACEYLEKVKRPQQVQLTLAECVQRTIENNYSIRIEAHNPAISQTQIVEAEAAFDTEFFLDTSWSDLDQAVMPDTTNGYSDTRSIQGGFRKLMPTGMSASVGLGTSRQWSGQPQTQPKTWNPQWPSNMIATLRQPLLRGFGLDVNRATIMLRNVDYKITQEAFVQKVRDTLLDVETAYWQLASARRSMAIQTETVAQNLITWQNMVERLDHDATQVEVANAESRFQQRYVAFLESIKNVKVAEDSLKNLMNDPAFKLSDDVEILPVEIPFAAPIVLDQFAEVRTALDQRTEIKQARQRIEGARISTNAAKNAILPRLDVSFQYEVQGLGATADNSFDNLTTNRFVSYTLGVSFSYNFGERAARAAHRRAQLQESQAVVALNQASDVIVEEVNQTIRTLMVRYEQIPPALLSVIAAERNLRSLAARTQKIDPTYLETELGAVEQLASTRSTLLGVLTQYNVGIVQLEKAKGTLLEYNNIVVTDAQPRR